MLLLICSPQSGDWSDVSESRVRGRQQRSSQLHHKIRENVRWEMDTEGEREEETMEVEEMLFKG